MALKDYNLPKDRTELKRILGIINVYRRFIPHIIQVQVPLCSLLVGVKKKDERVISWSKEQIEAFEETKRQLISATLLSHPLDNDAHLTLKKINASED